MLMQSVMDSIATESGEQEDVDVPLATFFDWHEDGIEDIIVVRNKTGSGGESQRPGQVTIGAFTNTTLASDAYFVKIIVLSGKRHSFFYVEK